MLPPGSRFRHYWDYMMVVVVLYNCILTPMQVGFCNGPIFVDSATPLSVLDVLLWLLFGRQSHGHGNSWPRVRHRPRRDEAGRVAGGDA